PYTIGDYLASTKPAALDASHPACKAAEADVARRADRLLAIDGRRSVDSFHRELGPLMWDHCGMARSASRLQETAAKVASLRREFWEDVKVTGEGSDLNQDLERAGRVADFFELAELMCRDAEARDESCGGHFREEHQTEDGEAKRDDAHFAHVAVWEW